MSDDEIPAGRLADGAPCHHQGESATFCTRCWMNLYEARHRLLEGEHADVESEGGALADETAAPRVTTDATRDRHSGRRHGGHRQKVQRRRGAPETKTAPLPATQHYALNMGITISEAGVEWKVWGKRHSRPLSEIVRVRLLNTFFAHTLVDVCYCVIQFRDGKKIAITNWLGRGKPRNELYAACVSHLHRALAVAGAHHVDFIAGPKPSFFRVLALGVLAVLWACLMGWLLWMRLKWGHALMFIDLFLLVMGPGLLFLLIQMVRATWMDWRLGDDGQLRYTPDEIPDWYLP